MKSALLLLTTAGISLANTAPTVVIQSAAMRPGTTLMDVVYRVNDPDDATVKTRALAFVDGERSFSKVIKPVTFVEGTAAKLGDAIPANVDHTLTWNVGADWNIDLGQVKFEVMAMDQRGLLPFDWISIPAAGGKPAMTISKDVPAEDQVLNALFWRYAAGDTGLSLTNGVLRGTSASGVFKNVDLANGTTVKTYGAPFIFKRMNLAAPDPEEMNHATNARAGLLNTTNEIEDWAPPSNNWHVINRAYDGMSILMAWGADSNTTTIPAGLTGVTAISAGESYSLALKSDGTVVALGTSFGNGQTTIPAGLSGVTAITAGAPLSNGGDSHCLALKSNGTVVGWGNNYHGQTTIPAGLNGVTAIAAGLGHSLALKSNGTVVGWGRFSPSVPAGLSGVTAISAGMYHCLALKNNGTVVAWGASNEGSDVITIPAGLSGVIAIAAGSDHNLALKSNGTVVAWGNASAGRTAVPAGLSGVTAISAGAYHNLALKSDGTVVAWGDNGSGQTTVPAGLSGVIAIAAGGGHSLVLKAKAP